VGDSSIISETFGKVAHPPLRVKIETNRKKKKKDSVVFIGPFHQKITSFASHGLPR